MHKVVAVLSITFMFSLFNTSRYVKCSIGLASLYFLGSLSYIESTFVAFQYYYALKVIKLVAEYKNDSDYSEKIVLTAGNKVTDLNNR